MIDKVELWHQKLKRVITIKKVVMRWKSFKKRRPRTRLADNGNQINWDITTADLKEAETTIFTAVQREAFHEEFHILSKARADAPDGRRQGKIRSSSLNAHNPFIAADGLIRVGSRLVNALVREEVKFPVILPRGSPTVQSYIRKTHTNALHCGAKQTLSELRQHVWILQGLQEVRKILTRCIKCQKAFKRPMEQRMAPLPAARVNQGHAWEETGLDYAGPIGVRMAGRAIHKIWICIFSCMKTRAVHAEIVYNLDAASAVNAIVRFCARRPGARTFWSDQGTNLTLADRILKREMAKCNSDATSQLQQRGLEWRFIPPGTPHYGGVWERMVALFKRNLLLVLEKEALHVDVINTAIVEIEAVINRRPLTAISASSSDYEAITPAHILYPETMSHSSALVVENVSNDEAERMRCS